MDDQAYLEAGFDPALLTVPRLRSILVQHNVDYPSSAKKGQLIDLFNENVVPQARKIKSASLRVKRSSRGIVDVPPSQSTADGEEEEEQVRPPPSTGRRSAGRTTRARTEEAEEIQPAPRSTRHSTAPPEATPRRATSKHARTVEKVVPEEEPEPKRPASRKSRQSAATPVVKQEAADDSPFSMDNVFQSGSSPPAPTDRRRTTQSVVKDDERHRSRDGRRRTDEVRPARQQKDGAVVPTRRTFEMPVSAMKKERVEPNEEFTPEGQQELVLAEQSGELVPARPKARRPASKTVRTGAGAFVVTLLTAFAALWAQEKSQVGYCGVGRASTEIAGVQIPEWADVIRPECEPCPPHAMCNEKFETVCEPGFILTQHPLSFGGVLPVAPTCEPDSARLKQVKDVKERTISELRERNAQYECGEAPSPEVKETELKKDISSMRRRSMSNEEFEDLWNAAWEEVVKVDEVSQGTDG